MLAHAGDHEDAEDHRVGDVPDGGQGELAVADVAPHGDDGGEQQEGEHEHLRHHEVERRAGPATATGDVPLLLTADQHVEQRPRVDRERHGGEHEALPPERPEREEGQHDLHAVEPEVEQQPGREPQARRHRAQVEVDLQRRHQEQQRRGDAGEVVGGRDEVHDPLVGGEPALAAERVVRQQDLEPACRPALLLLREALDGLRGVADGEHVGDVDAAPAALVQHQRGPHVLGLGVGVHAPDVVDGRPAEHDVGADAEGRVEVVPARLDEPVEHGLHVAGSAGDDRREVAVGLRGLHEGDVLADEERHRLEQEVLLGHEVGVEDGEVVALRDGQRVVDVARLGAVVRQPADVVAAQLGRELLDLVRPAVVEDPGAVPAGHPLGRGGRAPDGGHRLAVDGDEDVDEHVLAVDADRPVRGVAAPGHRAEQGVPGRVEGVVTRAGRTGQDGPHRDEGLADQHRLGDDDHRPRQQVAPVAGVEEEPGVQHDPHGGQRGEEDDDG